MPYCPKCGMWIDSLNQDEKVWQRYILSVDGHGREHYEQGDLSDEGTNDDPQIMCPECDEVLFSYNKEAVAFLKSCRKQRMKKKCDKCADRFKCWTARN